MSSSDEAALPRRLRSHARSHRGGPDTDNPSRSRSRDLEEKDSPEREAVGGGTSEGSLERPSSSPKSRATPSEEGSQQRTDTEAVVPRLSYEDLQREPSPGSAARQWRSSPSSAARQRLDSSRGRDARDGSLSSAAEAARTQRALEKATATTLRRKRRLR